MPLISVWYRADNQLTLGGQAGPVEATEDAAGNPIIQLDHDGLPGRYTHQVDLTDPDNPALIDPDSAVVDALLLPEDQAAAANQINAAAANILGAVASPYGPQVAVYTAKEAEATAYQSDASPDAADYPLLEAGRTVEGRTLAEEAAAVLAEAALWKQAGAAVDATRRTANKAVAAATTRAEVQAVLDGLTWPDLGL